MARLSPTVFSSYITSEKRKNEKAINQAINQAFTEGKIRTIQQKEIYRKIGLKMGLDVISELINSISIVKPSDIIKLANNTHSKYEKEKIPTNPSERLMYYRKYNPEYLKENPEEFDKLLKSLK